MPDRRDRSRAQPGRSTLGRVEGPHRTGRAGPVGDVPVGAAGVPVEGYVGTHGHRVADRLEQRQVGVGVGVGERRHHVDAVLGGVGLHPRGARLPDERGGRQVAGADAPVVDGEVGGLDVVEQRPQRPGQRPDGAGDQHRLVTGRAVLADPAHGVG
jgi:hypothetical protein